MTLISIVTPSYNQAQFLEATMQSVLRQEGVELEYLVIDGGSTDGSVEIIRRHAARLAGWVSEPDGGQAEAINKGLQRTRGEFVAWLNSDDLYLPGALRSAAAALQADSALGMVFGDALTIDADGRPLNRLQFGDWGLAELLRFRIICQPAVMMRRSVLEQTGLLDPGYHYMLDHHLWLRMASLAPARHVDELWAAARQHPAAKNVAHAEGFAAEIRRLLEWIEAEPELTARVSADRRRIQGGAERLAGRYLLDGGQYRQALSAYGRALRLWPRYTLQHSHRMLYALLSLAGGQGLGRLYYRWFPSRPGRRPDLSAMPGLAGWPGLEIEAQSHGDVD